MNHALPAVALIVAALIFLITIIGVLGGLLTFLLYFLLLLVGYVSAGIGLGDRVLKRVKSDHPNSMLWRVGGAVAGVLIVSVLVRIPWMGTWVALAALVTGVGVLVMQVWTVWKSRDFIARAPT